MAKKAPVGRRLTRDRLWVGSDPSRFFAINLRFVVGIDEKRRIPFRTAISRYHAKCWTILSKKF